MNRIDELIERLCPDGVEYRAIGDFAKVVRGSGLQKKDFSEEGIGCIHYGQIYTYYKMHAYETKSKVSPELAKRLLKIHPGDIVVAVTSENMDDICKAVVWLGDDEIVTGGHSAVISNHGMNPCYLAYCFQTEAFQVQKRKLAMGTKVIEMKADKLAKIRIPVPPMEVQEEIVRVLDSFAKLEAELEAELRAELEARRRQYAYYRDKLLSFENAERESSSRPIGTVDDLG